MLVYYENWQIPPITQQRNLIPGGFKSKFWNNHILVSYLAKFEQNPIAPFRFRITVLHSKLEIFMTAAK